MKKKKIAPKLNLQKVEIARFGTSAQQEIVGGLGSVPCMITKAASSCKFACVPL